MSSSADKRQIYYSNMHLLGFNHARCTVGRVAVAFNVDMFKVPNKAAFEAVTHFLFTKLNPNRAERDFRNCVPVSDRKREQMFRMVCNEWLSQISQDEPDSGLPKIVPSILLSPGGDKFCNLMFAFSNYVVRHVIANEHGIKSRDMLFRPMLSPQNMELFLAMVHSMNCAVISHREKFFEKLQTREALHRMWKKSASAMVKDYRRLSKELRQREADIKSLLDEHREKGFRSPVRLDRTRKALTPSRNGRLLDVSVESVRRQERVQQVRDLWHTLEGFLSANSHHQEVVSAILSGVVNEYVLDASELDLRVPEMLLRECKKELLKRDIGNTYKAGMLDLVSTLHLWNLSLHLYLERLEDGPRLDLSGQLKHLQSMLHGQASELYSCKQLASSLRDQLIPELKESIRQQKAKRSLTGAEQYNSSSKLAFSLQPCTPPLSFDPNRASAHEVQAARMTFTPDLLPQESTPDAVSRIMDSINKAIKPDRLACADVTNQQKGDCNTVNRMMGSAISPLAQGKMVHRRRVGGERAEGSAGGAGESPSRLSSKVQVKRVGSRQITKLIKDNSQDTDGGIFSPTEAVPASFDSVEQLSMYIQDTTTPVSDHTSTPTSLRLLTDRIQQLALATGRETARERMCAQVAPPSKSSVSEMESPSDVLAARIAQSITEAGSGDQLPSATQSFSPSVLDSMYSVSNVLDELGTSGFVSRDRIERTPNSSAANANSSRMNISRGQGATDAGFKSRVIFPAHTMLDRGEREDIVTVASKDTRRGSNSSSLSTSPPLPDSTTDFSQLSGTDLQQNNRVHSSMAIGAFWSPARAAGRRIMDDVLDEQPLFIDSPVMNSGGDAELMELLPASHQLEQSSGFTLSQLVPKVASLSTLEESAEELSFQDGERPNHSSLQDLVARFELIKKKSSAVAANQQQLTATLAARGHLTDQLLLLEGKEEL